MKVEYIIDESGNQKAVLIDINDWKKFNQKYKLRVLINLEKAIEEVKEIKSGIKQKRTLKELLNEI